MTMDQFYLPITLILLVAALVRAPAAITQPLARPAWFATLLAIPALLSRGAPIPIQTLDEWLGGTNLIFLVQCWFATFAFWALCEAAAVDATKPERVKVRLWVPAVWCAVFTVPFFLIQDRAGTELFFIDAHVQDPAAIVCGVLYMLGIVAISIRLIWMLRGRRAIAYWAFRLGAALIVIGSLLWSVAIVIDHIFALHRSPVLWMYYGFDVFFYPGVVVLALGLVAFALQRQIRRSWLRRRVDELGELLQRRGFAWSRTDTDLPFAMYDLVVQIQDLRTLGKVVPTAHEAMLISRASSWVDRTFPEVQGVVRSKGGE